MTCCWTQIPFSEHSCLEWMPISFIVMAVHNIINNFTELWLSFLTFNSRKVYEGTWKEFMVIFQTNTQTKSFCVNVSVFILVFKAAFSVQEETCENIYVNFFPFSSESTKYVSTYKNQSNNGFEWWMKAEMAKSTELLTFFRLHKVNIWHDLNFIFVESQIIALICR
jgi:hypothetical protein